MGIALKVELSEETYAALERRAQAVEQSPGELAADALEQCFGTSNGEGRPEHQSSEREIQARFRFERHFGAVDLGHATGADNESIDADLARAYADDHKGS